MFHVEVSVDVQQEPRGESGLVACCIRAEPKGSWDSNINLAEGFSITTLNLDDSNELDGRDVVSDDCGLNVDDDAEIVGGLGNSLHDESQFEETLVLGGILVGESKALMGVKILLRYIKNKLCS
jgi:hypothetical protein